MNLSPARFAFGPLWEKARPLLLAHDDTRPNRYSMAGPTLAALVRLTGIPRKQWERYKQDGLTLAAADRAALALGYMPWDIWDNYWVDVDDDGQDDDGTTEGEAA